MTSAQLILVSVSSALIAVIAMLVVATVLRARTREGTGGDTKAAMGTQTRAQRAAARAQKRVQRVSARAEKKALKAAASVAKAEKRKTEAEKRKAEQAAATQALTTRTPGKPETGGATEEKTPADKGPERDSKGDAAETTTEAGGPTTEAGLRAAAGGKPRRWMKGEPTSEEDASTET
ncbi:MAG: hypothetical protein ACRDK3_08110 [Actinomycetota bacterium]